MTTPNPDLQPAIRSRILLRLGYGRESAAAMQAAIDLARAYDSDIDGVFVEDRRVRAASALSCARLVSPFGRRSWAMTESDLPGEVRAVTLTLRRKMEEMAAGAHVTLHFRQEMKQAQEDTPPRFIVLGELPESDEINAGLQAIVSGDASVKGVIVTGPQARMASGPVAALIDAPEAAETLLDAARRVASVSGARVAAVPVTATLSGLSAIGKAVKAFGEREADIFYRDLVTRHQDVLGTLRRLRSGFAVAAYGRGFLADPGILKKFVRLLDTPLLLVKVAESEERDT